MNLKGKIAVVTGASTGIGLEIARMIAASGARVGLVARPGPRLDQALATLKGPSPAVMAFPTDLRDVAAINKLASSVRQTWGDVDVLVHAAGVWHDDSIPYAGVPLVSTPESQVNEVLDVGIRAPMLLTRAVLPGMIAKKCGKILSISGTFASGGAGWLHYYVSKLALEHLTVGLAQELRQHEIQVNCISPSDTDTEALRRFFPDDAKTAINPTEIARLAGFLLSESADHITGQVIVIKNKAVH